MNMDVADRTVTCGLWSWRPKGLQRFANPKTYFGLYSFIGIVQGMTFSYVTVILSTVEREFGLKSKESAWMYSGNEISQILFMFFVPFLARVTRRPLFMGLALMMSAFGLLLMALPHFTAAKRPGGGVARPTDFIELCSEDPRNTTCYENALDAQEKYYLGLVLIFIGIFIVGIGGSFYYAFGLSYGDDNTEKGNSPLMIGLVWASRLLGPGLGFMLGGLCLKANANFLNERKASYQGDDIDFVGAWWLGFPIIALILFAASPWFTLFPRRFDSQKTDAATLSVNPKSTRPKSALEVVEEFLRTYKRLLTKKIYVLNLLSVVFFFFGILGYSTFLPKYLEYHFRRNAATVGSLGGLIKTIAGALGAILSGYLIGKFKLSARKLAMWNFLVGLFSFICFLIFMMLSCPKLDFQTVSDCTKNCHCSKTYDPVCSVEEPHVMFHSPCEAGCSMTESKTVFSHCQCFNFTFEELVPLTFEKSITFSHFTKGYCPVDCTTEFYAFLGLLFVVSFLGATTKPPNALIMLRCIDPKDKAASISLILFSISLFGSLPAPFAFGDLVDRSCVLWDETCAGQSKNCLVYDTDMMRHLLNGFCAIFIVLSFICDFGVFLCVKKLKLFD